MTFLKEVTMNQKYRDIISSEEELTTELAQELVQSTKTVADFLKNPKNRDEMNEPIEEFETLLQDHMLLLRDLVRRCVAHKATLEKNRSFIKSGFDVIFEELLKIPLEDELLSDYKFFDTNFDSNNKNNLLGATSILSLLPCKKSEIKVTSATINDFLPFWNICFRGKWEKFEEYLKGDLLYIDLEVDNSDEYALNNNNNNRFQDTKRYWFVAKKNLPRNSHKEPHPTKLELTQWDPMSNEDLEKDENLFNLDYDLAMKLCRYFSLTFTEFSNFADEVCKYIVLKDVSDFENHYENMEILHGSIFATFLMTSALLTFCKEDIERTPVAKLYIHNAMRWIKQTCTSFESFHAPLVKIVQRLTTFWPVPMADQKRIEIVFLHGEGEARGFITRVTQYKKRSGTTSISMSHPIQSILMYANCLYDFKYNLFDFNSQFTICFFDQHDDPLVIDTISTSTNMTLSKAIGKLEVKSEITIVAKCIDPSVKLRPCLPIQCSVENKRIEGMVIMIPTGASLHQARQLIIDYAFSFQSTTIEVYNQGNILEVKTALKELLVCGEWEYIHNGDKIDEEDEKTTSAIEYAVSQGSLEMVDGEQSTNLVFAFAPIDTAFFTETFINVVQTL